MSSTIRYKAQMALRTCERHPDDELDLYCKLCKKPICTECAKGNHVHHDWVKMSKMAQELNHQAAERKKTTTSKIRSFSAGMKKSIDYLKSQNENNFTRNTNELESTRAGMHALVDNLVDGNLSKCKDHLEKWRQKLQQIDSDLSSRMTTIESLVANTTDGAHKYSDFDLVELHDELSTAISELNSNAFPLEDWEEIKFARGTTDENEIANMIGSVSTTPPYGEYKEVADFHIADIAINSLCPVSSSRCWVHVRQTTHNTLYDIKSTVRNTKELKCLVYNFVVSDDGVMYFCDLHNQTINSVDTTGQCKLLFNVKPLLPILINLTHSGDLFVTMVDAVSYYRSATSRRLVKRMTLTGDTIQEYEYDNDYKTSLFTFPVKAIEHYNGDLSILDTFMDRDDNIVGTIVGVSGSRLIYRYTGQNKPYNPLDLCCDLIGNTITSDYYNEKIHLINPRGQFLRYLVSELPHEPHSGALYDNTLWVGSNDGYISVYEQTIK